MTKAPGLNNGEGKTFLTNGPGKIEKRRNQTPYTKVNLKWVTDRNVRPPNHKILRRYLM